MSIGVSPRRAPGGQKVGEYDDRVADVPAALNQLWRNNIATEPIKRVLLRGYAYNAAHYLILLLLLYAYVYIIGLSLLFRFTKTSCFRSDYNVYVPPPPPLQQPSSNSL